MRTDYSTFIQQSEEVLLVLEKRHRNAHLSHCLKMLEALELEGRYSKPKPSRTGKKVQDDLIESAGILHVCTYTRVR
jgi:hypothetical protein